MRECVEEGFDIRLRFCVTCHDRLQSCPHPGIPLRIPPRILAGRYCGREDKLVDDIDHCCKKCQ
jgi:hypothetical protein